MTLEVLHTWCLYCIVSVFPLAVVERFNAELLAVSTIFPKSNDLRSLLKTAALDI
jgi:hypothetical protein